MDPETVSKIAKLQRVVVSGLTDFGKQFEVLKESFKRDAQQALSSDSPDNLTLLVHATSWSALCASELTLTETALLNSARISLARRAFQVCFQPKALGLMCSFSHRSLKKSERNLICTLLQMIRLPSMVSFQPLHPTVAPLKREPTRSWWLYCA